MIGGHHIHWPPLALAALLALLGFWLNLVGVRPNIVDNAGFGHDPDYVVERFDALAFDVRGEPRHRLAAERMTHYMDDDTTVLDNPVFVSTDPLDPVDVRARRALLSADRRHVHFMDQVHVSRRSQAGREPITMETEYLHVTPDERVMRTDKGVVFRQGNSTITASTLFADGKAGVLSLGGGVRGTYDRTH